MKNENTTGNCLFPILEVRSDSQGNVDWNAVPWRGYLGLRVAQPLPHRFRERATKEGEDIRRLAKVLEPMQLHVAELWGELGDDDHPDIQISDERVDEIISEVVQMYALAQNQRGAMGVVP
jgi:hypothetical protein